MGWRILSQRIRRAVRVPSLAREIALNRADSIPNAVQAFDALEAAARARHHGGKVKKGEIGEKNGRYIHDAEMTHRDGEDWDVHVDATTGLLLKDEKD